MTDSELVAAIRKILRQRPRLKGIDKQSVEAADLARFDQIAGLLGRHPIPKTAKPRRAPKTDAPSVDSSRT